MSRFQLFMSRMGTYYGYFSLFRHRDRAKKKKQSAPRKKRGEDAEVEDEPEEELDPETRELPFVFTGLIEVS